MASPGVVISRRGRKAVVDFGGNEMEADAGLVEAGVGDHVLVHAGCIIQTMSEELAAETEELYRLLFS